MLLPTMPAPITTTLARSGRLVTRIPSSVFVVGSQHSEEDDEVRRGKVFQRIRASTCLVCDRRTPTPITVRPQPIRRPRTPRPTRCTVTLTSVPPDAVGLN